MAASIVGVDIGALSIRAVEVRSKGKVGPLVLHAHQVALPEGAVRSGEVLEVNTVSAALRQLWSIGRFTSKNVVLGMGSSKVLVRELSVPKLSQAEIIASLPSYVQDMLPVPVIDALLDFYPTSEGDANGVAMVNGLLVAAVKASVVANVEAVQKAGLQPVGVDLIPFALTRGHAMQGNVAYIDVGARTTNVVVTIDGVPQFVRIIPSGGDDLTTALAGRLEVPEDQAQQLPHEVGLGVAGVAPNLLPAVEIIREITGELLNSLRNTLAYFSNTHRNQPYSGLVLTGGGSDLIGFSDALAEITRIPVTRFDPFMDLTIPKNVQDLTYGERTAFNVALGLAMGSAA
jgi:type IV pilus assembly protein PilM